MKVLSDWLTGWLSYCVILFKDWFGTLPMEAKGLQSRFQLKKDLNLVRKREVFLTALPNVAEAYW